MLLEPVARVAVEALPGVGRKTANFVLNTAFGEPTVIGYTEGTTWVRRSAASQPPSAYKIVPVT